MVGFRNLLVAFVLCLFAANAFAQCENGQCQKPVRTAAKAIVVAPVQIIAGVAREVAPVARTIAQAPVKVTQRVVERRPLRKLFNRNRCR